MSVIIPCLNEQARITAAVRSAWDAGATQVLVVDGGSDDESVRRAQSISATEVIESPLGRGLQLAMGGQHATGDWLLFLHADNRLPAVAWTQIQDIGRPAWGGFRQQILATGLPYRMLEQGNAFRIRTRSMVFGDQGLFVHRDLYRESGGFEAMPLMEDVAICHRLRSISSATLLPGPVEVDARRWQSRGVVRQTLRNWRIQRAYRKGVEPQKLADWYRQP
ncbi:MAG: TIGR04283 family arsenosugar biosynthesis glycosyltransferase [Planctomycetota bacterium]